MSNAHYRILKHKLPGTVSDKLCVVSTVDPFTKHGTYSNSSSFHLDRDWPKATVNLQYSGMIGEKRETIFQTHPLSAHRFNR